MESGISFSESRRSKQELKSKNRLRSCMCDGCRGNPNHELELKDSLQPDECDSYCGHPEHKLELINSYLHSYTCDGCKEKGSGPRYRCESCDYDLHEACMFPSSTTHHEFFKDSTFRFFKKPPTLCNTYNCKKDHKRYCDACTKPIKGFAYQSEEKKFDLHPCCMNLKRELNINGTKFRLQKSKNVSEKLCVLCDKKKVAKDSFSSFGGLSYVSECEECHLHVYCVKKLTLVSMEKNGGNDKAWKKNEKNGDDNECLELEKTELSIQRLKRNKNGGKLWKRTITVFKIIAGILLGDPTMILASLLVDLLT